MLHPLLARRWSPLGFDPAHELSLDDVMLLLEAARWAPSAGNSQPWSFLVGRRGDAVHQRLVGRLAPSSRRWAPSASLLVANLSHRLVESTDWEFSEFSLYDLGQAVAHLTLQAEAMDLRVRQFRAFDRDGVAADFDVPPHWEVTTMAAIGRVPAGAEPPSTTDSASRQRRSIEEILWVPLER
ncbi:MAG: nitroreductase family protein [Nocardioides sp.]